MAIDIILQNIKGDRRGEVVDPDYSLLDLWPIGDPAFPLLQYLDPYGNAVFNESQMPQVIEELEALKTKATSEAQRSVLTQIVALAQKCGEHHHLFLRFSGD